MGDCVALPISKQGVEIAETEEPDEGSTFVGFAKFSSIAEALNSPNLVAVNQDDPRLFYQTPDTTGLHRRLIGEGG